MIDLIQNKTTELNDICEKHLVKSLHLFGSATNNKFKPSESDLDFVVEFKTELAPIDFADNFFSLMDELKNLFQKEIDLLSSRALKNQVIISEIEETKVQLYAA